MINRWMEAAWKQRLLPRPNLRVFFIRALLCGGIPLVNLLLLPASAQNALFLGYSASRLAMLAGILLVILATGAVWLGVERRANFHKRMQGLLTHRFASVQALFGVLIALTLLAASYSGWISNPYTAERLRPGIWLLLLHSANLLVEQILLHRGRFLERELAAARRANQALERWTGQASLWLERHLTRPWFVAGLLLAALPFLFGHALQHSYPLGYAGLYALVSEEIAAYGFALPVSIDYYGPGGMVFAYPPAGFYLMALVIKLLPVGSLDYLRFAPPLFMWLSLIPLALLALEWFDSRPAALISVLLVAGSQKIFLFQTTAAGMVRGLAFLLALTGAWLFLRAYRKASWKEAVLSGVVMALTALVHLGYAQFAALFALAFFLTHLRSPRAWALLAIMGATTLTLVSGWVALMVSQFGWPVFLNAFQSHGNDYFLSFLQHPERLLPWFETALLPVLRHPLMWGALVFGLFIAFFERKPHLPLWFGLTLVFTSENSRYLITLGALLAGLCVGRLGRLAWLTFETDGARARTQGAFWLATALLFAAVGWQDLFGSFAAKPLIGPATIELAEYVQMNIPEDQNYLVVADSSTAEWFPYLLKRAPVIGSWGAEWTGTYQEHLGYLLALEACLPTKTFDCLADLLETLPARPHMMITLAEQMELNQSISGHSEWRLIYENDGYRVWQAR